HDEQGRALSAAIDVLEHLKHLADLTGLSFVEWRRRAEDAIPLKAQGQTAPEPQRGPKRARAMRAAAKKTTGAETPAEMPKPEPYPVRLEQVSADVAVLLRPQVSSIPLVNDDIRILTILADHSPKALTISQITTESVRSNRADPSRPRRLNDSAIR